MSETVMTTDNHMLSAMTTYQQGDTICQPQVIT
jgi:hypothetical protein